MIKITITGRGTIMADSKNMRTAREGVYAGGDVVSGPATVVEAIAAGKKAAIAINAAISGQTAAGNNPW